MRYLLGIVLALVCFSDTEGSREKMTQRIRKNARTIVENYLIYEAPNAEENFYQMIDKFVNSDRPDWHFTLLASKLCCFRPSSVRDFAVNLLDVPNLFVLDEVAGFVEPAEEQANLANIVRRISKIGFDPVSDIYDLSRRLFKTLTSLVEDELPLFFKEKDLYSDDSAFLMIRGLVKRLKQLVGLELSVEVIVELTLFKDAILFMTTYLSKESGFPHIFLPLFSDAINICLESESDWKISELAVVSNQLENLLLEQLESFPQLGQLVLSKYPSMKKLVSSVKVEEEVLRSLVPMILEYIDLRRVEMTPTKVLPREEHKFERVFVDVWTRVINNPERYSTTALARWTRKRVAIHLCESTLEKNWELDESTSLAFELAKFYGIDFLNDYSTSLLLDWLPSRKQALGVLLQAAVRYDDFSGPFGVYEDLVYLVGAEKLIKTARVVTAMERADLGSRSAPLVSSPWDWALGFMGLTKDFRHSLSSQQHFTKWLLDRFDQDPFLLPPKIGHVVDLRRRIKDYLIGFPPHLVRVSKFAGNLLESSGETISATRSREIAKMPQTAAIFEAQTGKQDLAKCVEKYIALSQEADKPVKRSMNQKEWNREFLDLYREAVSSIDNGENIKQHLVSRFAYLAACVV